jgi:hypothetical protein
MYALRPHGALLVVTVYFSGSCGTNVDHKKSTGKENMAKTIKRSSVIKALQLTALFAGGAIRQQKRPHLSVEGCVGHALNSNFVT